MERSITAVAVSGAFLLVGFTQAIAQTEGPGRELTPSNVIRLSADTPRTGTLTVSKSFVVPYAGTVRASWQLRSNESGKTATVSVTSLIDGCSNNSSAQTFVAQSCDLRVVAGDRVIVTASGQMDISTPGVNSSVSIKGVRLRWNVKNSAGTGTVLTD